MKLNFHKQNKIKINVLQTVLFQDFHIKFNEQVKQISLGLLTENIVAEKV